MTGRGPLRWGIASAGLICNDFVVALETLPPEEHKVVAVGASSQERADKFAQIHSIPRAHASYEELAKDKDIEVVFVGSINSMHYKHVKLMLEHGKHVLCEKPMGLNVKETKALIHMARHRKLFLMQGICSRFYPLYHQLRLDIEQKKLGEVMAVQVSMGFNVHERERTKERLLGGGGLYDFGIYLLSFANWVFDGKPHKISVTGHLTPGGVDESAGITLSYHHNRLANLIFTTKADLPNEAHVFGSEGHAKLWPVHCPVNLESPSGVHKTELPRPPKTINYENSTGLRFEAQEVRRCIMEGRLDSAVMPHSETELVAHMMQDVRKHLGIHFDQDHHDLMHDALAFGWDMHLGTPLF